MLLAMMRTQMFFCFPELTACLVSFYSCFSFVHIDISTVLAQYLHPTLAISKLLRFNYNQKSFKRKKNKKLLYVVNIY